MKDLTAKLVGIGPILPGTLVTLKRPLKDGVRHRKKGAGTSHMLSYNVKGCNSSMYVKGDDYATVASMVANYNQARDLIIELGLAMVARCREEGIEQAGAAWKKQMAGGVDAGKAREDGSAARQLRVLGRSRDSWKKSSMARSQVIAQQKMTMRDLSTSREKWRAEALSRRVNAKADTEKIRKLEAAVETLECRVAATDSKKKRRQAE